MDIKDLAELIKSLAWPVVVVIVVVVFREEMRAILGRIRGIEGPGDVKLTLDSGKIEKIIEEGQKQNATASSVADKIVKSSTIVDKRESRILRALLDDEGRSIYSYQSNYYKPALESLIAKGYVERAGKGYALTQEGRNVTKDYISGVIATF
jgi:hypothetical protein